MFLASLTLKVVNLLYRVPSRIRQFQRNFPEAQIVAYGATKARKMEQAAAAVQREMGWVTAKRDVLVLTSQGLHCGDWTIPLATVQDATLVKLGNGAVLKLSTAEGAHYQFGLSADPAWEQQTVLPMQVETQTLKFSKISLLMRLVVLAWLACLIAIDIAQQTFGVGFVLKAILLLWFLMPLLRSFRR